MAYNKKFESQESETGFKFDARLRYVENLINAHIVFLQAHNEKLLSNNNKPPIFYEKYNIYLMNLFSLLKLHDDTLIEPNFINLTKEYTNSLLYHNMIKKLTQNKFDDKSIEEQIDEDYQ